MTTAHYDTLITELDKLLSTLRELWMQASTDSPEKRKWAKRLDESLDERMRLMRARDAVSIISSPTPPVDGKVIKPRKRA